MEFTKFYGVLEKFYGKLSRAKKSDIDFGLVLETFLLNYSKSQL